jgi:hypothetical protein
LSKVKKFLVGAAKAAGVEVLRGYVVKRISEVSPDDLIKAIESGDTDLYGKLSAKEKKLFATVACKFGEHVDLLTVKNVFSWLLEDLPFYAGVVYGHPKGLQWLGAVLAQIRERARAYARAAVQAPAIELVPATEASST